MILVVSMVPWAWVWPGLVRVPGYLQDHLDQSVVSQCSMAGGELTGDYLTPRLIEPNIICI